MQRNGAMTLEERHGPHTKWQRIFYGIGGGDARLVHKSFSCFAKDREDRLQLTCGGILMLAAQICIATVLLVISITQAVAFVGRAPFAPPRNITAEIAEAKVEGQTYSPAEIAAMEEDGFSWTYFRLWWFVISLMLSVLHRCLLLDAAWRDPVAIAIRYQQALPMTTQGTQDGLWDYHPKNDIELFAKALFRWLWIPVSLVGLILFGIALLSGTTAGNLATFDWVLYALSVNLFPIINTAATSSILGSQCVAVHKFAEGLLEPYGIDPEPYGGSAWTHKARNTFRPHAPQPQTRNDPEPLLARFRELACELENLSRGWKYVLGIQACYFCAQLGSTTTTIYRRHGYQTSLVTGQTLEDNQAFFYLAQTLPVFWALWLSVGTIIHLNTYLANIPDRVSRSSRCAQHFSFIDRAAFAAEYTRLGVHLDVPYIGELTTGTRWSALASFVCFLLAAATWPAQLKDTLGV